MSKITLILTMIVNLIIIYLLYYNMQTFTSKKHFFGVYINQKYIDRDEFKNLNKAFKRLINIGFLVVLLLSLILILVFNKDEFGLTFSLLGFLSYNFIVYVKIHNKTKEIKNDLLQIDDNYDLSLSSKSIIDINFINEKDSIISKFKVLYSIPIFINLIISIYALINYPNMLDMIPNHWSFTGIADSFVKKSYFNVAMSIASLLGITILLSFISISSIKSRVKIDTENIEQSKIDNIKYLNKIGYTFFVIIISTTSVITNSIIAFISGPNINFFTSIIATSITMLASIYLIFIYKKSPNTSITSSYAPDDDESHWIFGSIYNNPNDPAFMVAKRFGVGWTINIATPLGKVFLITAIITLVILGLNLIVSFFK